MNKNKCCDHCEYQQMQDLPHKYMKELCTLELGTIHRCDVCSSSWMKSAIEVGYYYAKGICS